MSDAYSVTQFFYDTSFDDYSNCILDLKSEIHDQVYSGGPIEYTLRRINEILENSKSKKEIVNYKVERIPYYNNNIIHIHIQQLNTLELIYITYSIIR